MNGIVRGEMAQEESAPMGATEPARGGNEPQPQGNENDPALGVRLAAMKVIYDKATSEGVVKMLGNGEPQSALAQTTLFVLKALFDESKGRIPPDVMLKNIPVIAGMLSELGEAAGLPMNEQVASQAAAMAAQRLQQRFSGAAKAAPQATMQG